jgi:hypothetical protein
MAGYGQQKMPDRIIMVICSRVPVYSDSYSLLPTGDLRISAALQVSMRFLPEDCGMPGDGELPARRLNLPGRVWEYHRKTRSIYSDEVPGILLQRAKTNVLSLSR